MRPTSFSLLRFSSLLSTTSSRTRGIYLPLEATSRSPEHSSSSLTELPPPTHNPTRLLALYIARQCLSFGPDPSRSSQYSSPKACKTSSTAWTRWRLAPWYEELEQIYHLSSDEDWELLDKGYESLRERTLQRAHTKGLNDP